MTSRFLASLKTFSLSFVLERIPITWTSLAFVKVRGRSIAFNDSYSPDFLNELILGKRSLQSFDLIALARENIPSGLVDILQQQDLDILGVEGLQNLRYTLAR